MNKVFFLHFAATFYMVGIIWFIQLVHYPLLGDVARYQKDVYKQTHIRLTTWVVGPAMVVEFLTSAYLVWQPVPGFPILLAWAGFILIVIIWLSTAFLQAPRHEILAMGYVARTHKSLILTNRIRTLAWSLRGAILIFALNNLR